MSNDRFRAYELSFKPVSDLFDWWERAVGAVSASNMAELQSDLQDDKGSKKSKKTGGFFSSLFDIFMLFFKISCQHIIFWPKVLVLVENMRRLLSAQECDSVYNYVVR